jgi:hypothetical protein
MILAQFANSLNSLKDFARRGMDSWRCADVLRANRLSLGEVAPMAKKPARKWAFEYINSSRFNSEAGVMLNGRAAIGLGAQQTTDWEGRDETSESRVYPHRS